MINEDRLIQLFKDLCLIDAPALREREVVNWTKQYLESNGLQVTEDDASRRLGGNANNVIAWLRGNVEGAPKIFLSAHFDTVEPTAGLVIEERDGVFYSASDTILGADDKGGMAPAIEAVLALRESGRPHGDVCLLFSVAEEIGLLGASVIKPLELGLDFGYVLDTGPPVGSFVTRTATHDKLDVTIRGVPAHAGKDPEKGINAIQVAADAISNMSLGRISPNTTANIGVIRGGTATNVVCSEVKLFCEARSTEVGELDAQTAHMIREFEAAADRWDTTAEIEHHRHYSAYEVAPDSQVVTRAIRAAERLGMGGELRTTLGGSDANRYNASGCPCIVVGTGMEKIHTHDEHISRKDLIDTTRLALELIAVE